MTSNIFLSIIVRIVSPHTCSNYNQ